MGRQQRQDDLRVLQRQTKIKQGADGGYDFKTFDQELLEHLERIPPRDKRGRSLKRREQNG
jgi:hypothetical protein